MSPPSSVYSELSDASTITRIPGLYIIYQVVYTNQYVQSKSRRFHAVCQPALPPTADWNAMHFRGSSTSLALAKVCQVFHKVHGERIAGLDYLVEPLAHPCEVLSIPTELPQSNGHPVLVDPV